MFVFKKDYKLLENKVQEQDKLLHEMMYHLNQLAQELQELKKPKEPGYFA
ncbi:hypothetical protein [Metabacillus bambusae]|uniref:Uncharacterized protein n=1 Tax=Metabacillus bambusae TaxID=2795218 RepID=A0ABS3NBD5_9BACI|nr:hypothetical protein [Metabacillus bambusae]MBO1515597.1 hypothetical protein [Metabacillus bambusae]